MDETADIRARSAALRQELSIADLAFAQIGSRTVFALKIVGLIGVIGFAA
jgi:hypothetical protein